MQFEGAERPATPSLPVATTTTLPAAIASFTALCILTGHVEPPPRLRFITRAGVVLVGTPGTASPAAQRIASPISDKDPPHLPNARTGRIRTFQPTPAMPLALLVVAAATPATWEPCQLLGDSE